jgi:hypothetical protein
MGLFSEFFVFIDLFSLAVSIGHGDVEVLRAEDESLVDIYKSGDDLVGLLVDEMLDLGVSGLVLV